MHVQVEHGLAGARPHVEHSSIAVLDAALAGNVGGREMAAADHRGILGRGLLQPADVFFGHDEHMGRSLGIDIFEAKVCSSS